MMNRDLIAVGFMYGVMFSVLLAVLGIVAMYYWGEYVDNRGKDLNDGCNGLR